MLCCVVLCYGLDGWFVKPISVLTRAQEPVLYAVLPDCCVCAVCSLNCELVCQFSFSPFVVRLFPFRFLLVCLFVTIDRRN